MCRATSIKMPHKDWLAAIKLIPPTNYATLILILQDNGYTVIQNVTMYTNPYRKVLDRLSVICLSDYDNEVERLKKICGKKFRVTSIPNIQEIYITLV